MGRILLLLLQNGEGADFGLGGYEGGKAFVGRIAVGCGLDGGSIRQCFAIGWVVRTVGAAQAEACIAAIVGRVGGVSGVILRAGDGDSREGSQKTEEEDFVLHIEIKQVMVGQVEQDGQLTFCELQMDESENATRVRVLCTHGKSSKLMLGKRESKAQASKHRKAAAELCSQVLCSI